MDSELQIASFWEFDEVKLPFGKVKVIIAGHAESHADYRDKRE